MTHGEEVIVHIPEVDPVRHRWFVVSVVVTSGLVVGSWMLGKTACETVQPMP